VQVCCSVLQCIVVQVCCSVLQCIAVQVCCSVLQCIVVQVCCSVLQWISEGMQGFWGKKISISRGAQFLVESKNHLSILFNSSYQFFLIIP